MMLRAATVPGSTSSIISTQMVPSLSLASIGSVRKNLPYEVTGVLPPAFPFISLE